MSKWIDFVDAGTSASGKTRLWHVVSKEHGSVLGVVSWYGPWRKYVFDPQMACVFEEDCLQDIAAFVESRTTEHRQKARNAHLAEMSDRS